MTRLPKTPMQDSEEQRRNQLANYLSKLSESRQTLFLRALTSDSLKLDIQHRINQLKRTHQRGKPHEHRTQF